MQLESMISVWSGSKMMLFAKQRRMALRCTWLGFMESALKRTTNYPKETLVESSKGEESCSATK